MESDGISNGGYGSFIIAKEPLSEEQREKIIDIFEKFLFGNKVLDSTKTTMVDIQNYIDKHPELIRYEREFKNSILNGKDIYIGNLSDTIGDNATREMSSLIKTIWEEIRQINIESLDIIDSDLYH